MKKLLTALILLLSANAGFATVLPITGNTEICLGGHRLFTDSTAGGVWSIGNIAIANIDTTGLVHSVSAGTTVITYAVGAAYATATITVYPLPDAFSISGGGVTCAGGPGAAINMDGSQSGMIYSSYNLSTGTTGGGTVNTVGTGSAMEAADPYVAGQYEIIATSFLTNCSSVMYGVVTITNNPLPALIIGPDSLCGGATVVLTDSTAGGTWSTQYPSRATVVGSTGLTTGLEGFATLRYTLPTGCYRDIDIFVRPTTVPVIAYDWVDATLYATTGFPSYQWYDSLQGLIPGATSPSIAALYTEYYYVVVTNDANSCSRASSLYHFNAAELGVAEHNKHDGIAIYPIPTTDQLTIVSGRKIDNVHIIDIMGHTVYASQPMVSKLSVDVSAYSPGEYFIQVNDGKPEQFMKQ